MYIVHVECLIIYAFGCTALIGAPICGAFAHFLSLKTTIKMKHMMARAIPSVARMYMTAVTPSSMLMVDFIRVPSCGTPAIRDTGMKSGVLVALTPHDMCSPGHIVSMDSPGRKLNATDCPFWSNTTYPMSNLCS